jgi:hypothetical protein
MPRSFFALVLNRSRQRSRRCQSYRRNWPTIFIVAPRQPRSRPLTRAPLHHRPIYSIASTPLTRITCGTQIPIAPAAPQTYPFPRFPPLEAFGRRPPEHAAPPSRGRHPKPFTVAEWIGTAISHSDFNCSSPLCDDVHARGPRQKQCPTAPAWRRRPAPALALHLAR